VRKSVLVISENLLGTSRVTNRETGQAALSVCDNLSGRDGSGAAPALAFQSFLQSLDDCYREALAGDSAQFTSQPVGIYMLDA
jgi:hypothetical protein